MCDRTKQLVRGALFDDQLSQRVHLYIASYEDIDDLCNVINWAYRGKPSASNVNEYYSGWIGEQHLLSGARISLDELKQLIDDIDNNVLLVAKLSTESNLKIVGCCKICPYETKSESNDEQKDDVSVEYGLYAVDPDYQSQGIGTVLYQGVLVSIELTKEISFSTK